MRIDKETVDKVAHLSRLALTEDEKEYVAGEMTKILDWMDKLNEVNTDDVAPLIHMSAELNVLREDVEGAMLSHEAGLLNAPKKDSNYFRVPKVIE